MHRQRISFYTSYNKSWKQEGRQCTYNVTLGGVRATIDAVEKQKLLHIQSMCL
jgi:hypothetical protein